MRLEISRLVGHHGIGGGVGFIESVAGEFLQQVENLVGLFLRDIVGLGTTLHEQRTLFLHYLDLLFTHRPAQQVRTPEGVAGQNLGRLHHLFLINQNAVGFLRDRLEQRMRVFDFHLAVTAANEVRNQIHRTRAIQRNQRRDMLDRGQFEFTAKITHATGFQLKHPHRVAIVQ